MTTRSASKSRLSSATSQPPLPKSLEDSIAKDSPEEIRARYGSLPTVRSTEEYNGNWMYIRDKFDEKVSPEITFRARLYATRRMSPKLTFLVFRDQIKSVQGVLEVKEGRISEDMVRWVEHIQSSSIVLVKGKVRNAKIPVKTASCTNVEVVVKEAKECAFVVLAQLTPRYGCQVKWALNFPDAPNGTVEYATVSAMQAAKKAGCHNLTFGAGASQRLPSSDNMGGMRSTILDHLYQAIATRLKLTQERLQVEVQYTR